MKPKHLKLRAETLRTLTHVDLERVGGGGSLNCTNPTSVGIVGCAAHGMNTRWCVADTGDTC